MYKETFSTALGFKTTGSTVKETGYKLKKVYSFIERNLENPQDHKDINKGENSSLLNFMITSFHQKG